MEKYINKIIHGDCIEVMQDIPSVLMSHLHPFNLKKIRDLCDYLSWGGPNHETEWIHLFA